MAREKIDAEAGAQALKELKTLQHAELSLKQFVEYNYAELMELRERGFSCKQIHQHLQNRIGLKCTANTFRLYMDKAARRYGYDQD